MGVASTGARLSALRVVLMTNCEAMHRQHNGATFHWLDANSDISIRDVHPEGTDPWQNVGQASEFLRFHIVWSLKRYKFKAQSTLDASTRICGQFLWCCLRPVWTLPSTTAGSICWHFRVQCGLGLKFFTGQDFERILVEHWPPHQSAVLLVIRWKLSLHSHSCQTTLDCQWLVESQCTLSHPQNWCLQEQDGKPGT